MAVLTLSATGVGATETMNINLTQAAASISPPLPPAVLGLPTLAKQLAFLPQSHK